MHADAVIPSWLCPSQRKDVKPHYYQATKPELCDTIITKESSPISTLKLAHIENAPAKWYHLNIVQQRADTLESLLKLYAKLLEERLDELADVFRPFGERAVSSREMSIQ
jgi:NIMA (never in mitosis gene a)-related kinase 1/4/5